MVPLRQLDPTCTIIRIESDGGKERATPWKQICFTRFPGFYKVNYPGTTALDEEVALRNRILLPMPRPNLRSDSWLSFRREMLHLKHSAPVVQPLTRAQVISKYTGKMRARYEAAAESLAKNPVEKKDARIDCFLKVEKFPKETLKNKAPRVIQGRKPRYNLEIMRFLRPIEHWFYSKKEILKGKNLEQRAQAVIDCLEEFSNPTVYQIDCSKCDAHTHQHALRLEHNIYKKSALNHPKLNAMLDQQLHNVGYTPHGWKYTTEGRRASGDFNTGLGTSIICRSLLKACIRTLGLNAKFLCDGDDCVLITEGDLPRNVLDRIPQFYLECGYEITLEKADYVEKLIHCQTALIMTPTPIMVRKPWDTISKAMVSQKYFVDPDTGSAYLNQLSMCELALHRGVPVMQAFFEMVMKGTRGRKNRDFSDEFQHRYKLASALCDKRQDITLEARISFELAFGIDIAQQHAMEKEFGEMNFDLSQIWKH